MRRFGHATGKSRSTARGGRLRPAPPLAERADGAGAGPETSGRPPTLRCVLRCIQCGITSQEARGWRAYLMSDGEIEEDDADGAADGIAIYCVSCAATEFGPIQRRGSDRDSPSR